jgi:hypothetical protein
VQQVQNATAASVANDVMAVVVNNMLLAQLKVLQKVSANIVNQQCVGGQQMEDAWSARALQQQLPTCAKSPCPARLESPASRLLVIKLLQQCKYCH